MRTTLMILIATVLSLVDQSVARYETSGHDKKQKMEEARPGAGRGVNKASRGTKNETCVMASGQMECAVIRTKHGIRVNVDKVEDKVD